VGRGLLTMARARFVHLDLKPDKVFVQGGDLPDSAPGTESYPTAVLADFGCARRLDVEGMTATLPPTVWSSEQLWGNPAHAAPELHAEQARVRRQGGVARLDFSKQPVFELGVLAYEVCAGVHPVVDYSVTLEYGPDDVAALPEEYPPEFTDLCRHMVGRARVVVGFVVGFSSVSCAWMVIDWSLLQPEPPAMAARTVVAQ
jgi:serine/threonine protein kinase